jgi:predicted MPP superfamily phosphohydrolase
MRSALLTLFVLFAGAGLFAIEEEQLQQRINIHGTVFLDENQNGKREASERPFAGAVISNQADVIVSDERGEYSLSGSSDHAILFISIPDGHAPVGSFWKRLTTETDQIVDFPLRKTVLVTDFEFIHASDPHIQADSIKRIRKLRALASSTKPAFVLITGDLVHDALRVREEEARKYYDMFQQETKDWPVPLFTVPGNHEIFGIERHLSLVDPKHPLYGKKMYLHYFGPNYYSFTYGGIHFIGLDSVDYDDLWYYGHIDGKQLEWLKKDIAATPPDQPVVSFNHIPFATAAEFLSGFMDQGAAPTLITVNGKTTFRHVVSNAEEVLTELRKRPFPLALGGHMHLREALEYETEGNKTRFHQAAAVLGPRSIAGFKTPSGVTLYKVRNRVIDNGTFMQLK